MLDKKILVLKIVWRKSIASLHRLTQAEQRANLRRTAGDLTWVYSLILNFGGANFTAEYALLSAKIQFPHGSDKTDDLLWRIYEKSWNVLCQQDWFCKVFLLPI